AGAMLACGSNAFADARLASLTVEPPPPPPHEDIDAQMENNTDRPGSDFSDIQVASPGLCRILCSNRDKCRAWTYVRAANRIGGRCFMKTTATKAVSNKCCISGVIHTLGKKPPSRPSSPVLPGMEDNTDRPGSDYHRFDSAPYPSVCRNLCTKAGDRC